MGKVKDLELVGASHRMAADNAKGVWPDLPPPTSNRVKSVLKTPVSEDLLSNVCTPLQYSHWQMLILSTTVAVSKVPPRKTDRDRQVMHYSET